jgi:sulfate/thiosulfate-binding protein
MTTQSFPVTSYRSQAMDQTRSTIKTASMAASAIHGAWRRLAGIALLAAAAASSPARAAELHLLNVSYDPTRELYEAINAKFVADYKARTGDSVIIEQSHGGSSKQARAIIDGLEADVATLGIASDIDALHDHGNLVPEDWQSRLPNDSTPYTSTIVLLVRKGNPKHIKDWNDLARNDVQVITPNPKTSAGARWNFLGAYVYGLKEYGNNKKKALEFVGQIYKNVPVLDSGARGSTTTFAQRGIGDVMPTWENEAYLTLKEFGADRFEIVVPSISMFAQPPVTVVDQYAKKHGTEKLAKAYLEFLYTPAAQEIIAQQHYRPIDPHVAAEHAKDFPTVTMVNIKALGGWRKVQPDFFGDGGLFDQIYQKK